MRQPTFPLLSRRRGAGLAGGARASVHRGLGSEIVSSRPYRRGDTVRTIDWKASARLASARDSDEFVVREHLAQDVVRSVLVVDRRPGMALYPEGLPWIRKPAAVATAGGMIVDSTIAAQGLPGYLEVADPRSPAWLPPNRRLNAIRIRDRHLTRDGFTAPADNLTLAFRHLARSRGELPPGTFVFVVSDFLACPSPAVWRSAAALGWDVVPVVVQDPRWEQSFPDVWGFALPVAEPGTGRVHLVRLTRRQVRARREENERRYAALLQGFAALGLDPVLVPSEDAAGVLGAFLRWYERRLPRVRRR